MQKLSNIHQRVLDFITDELRAGRAFPTAQAIKDHIGWKSSQSASDALTGLVCAGKIHVVDRAICGRAWKYTYALGPEMASEAAE